MQVTVLPKRERQLQLLTRKSASAKLDNDLESLTRTASSSDHIIDASKTLAAPENPTLVSRFLPGFQVIYVYSQSLIILL